MHSSVLGLAVIATLATVLLPVSVDAHFTLSGPAPSREKQEYPNDNQRFWPIGAPANTRPLKDCLQYPRRQVASLSAGQQVTFPFEIGNGASHVGMCTAVLINLDNNQQTSLGQVDNCVSRDKAITLTMPGSSCPNCVVKVSVTAVHLGPNNPEFYDSCVDVNIGGGSGGNAGGNTGGNTDADAGDDTTADADADADTGAANGSTGNIDASTGNTDASTGNADTGATDDSASTGDNTGAGRRGRGRGRNSGRRNQAPATTTTTTPASAPAPAPAASSGACTAGAFACGNGGNTIRQCVQGSFVDFAVPPGTSCSSESGTATIVHKI